MYIFQYTGRRDGTLNGGDPATPVRFQQETASSSSTSSISEYRTRTHEISRGSPASIPSPYHPSPSNGLRDMQQLKHSLLNAAGLPATSSRPDLRNPDQPSRWTPASRTTPLGGPLPPLLPVSSLHAPLPAIVAQNVHSKVVATPLPQLAGTPEPLKPRKSHPLYRGAIPSNMSPQHSVASQFVTERYADCSSSNGSGDTQSSSWRSSPGYGALEEPPAYHRYESMPPVGPLATGRCEPVSALDKKFSLAAAHRSIEERSGRGDSSPPLTVVSSRLDDSGELLVSFKDSLLHFLYLFLQFCGGDENFFQLAWWLHRLVDRSIDRLIDWLVDGLIDPSLDWLIHWLIDWSIAWLIDPLIDWLIDWLVDGLFRFWTKVTFQRTESVTRRTASVSSNGASRWSSATTRTESNDAKCWSWRLKIWRWKIPATPRMTFEKCSTTRSGTFCAAAAPKWAPRTLRRSARSGPGRSGRWFWRGNATRASTSPWRYSTSPPWWTRKSSRMSARNGTSWRRPMNSRAPGSSSYSTPFRTRWISTLSWNIWRAEIWCGCCRTWVRSRRIWRDSTRQSCCVPSRMSMKSASSIGVGFYLNGFLFLNFSWEYFSV